MADCLPFSLPPVSGAGEERKECGGLLPSGDEAVRRSSSPSLESVTSTATSSRSRKLGLVEKNLEATAKLRYMREHKGKHRQKLRDKLPPLDEMKVKRYVSECVA